MADSENKKEYINPTNAVLFILHFLVLGVWFLPLGKITDSITFSGYKLIFDKDVHLDLYICIFVFHVVSMFLSLAGDYKVVKCITLPLLLFNSIASIVILYTQGFIVTFWGYLVMALYMICIGFSIYDLCIRDEKS